MKLHHKKHRYSGQRRVNQKKRKITALVVIIIMVLIVIGTIFLGLYLKDKVERTTYPNDLPPETTQGGTDSIEELTAALDNDFYADYYSIVGLTEENAPRSIRRIIEEDEERLGGAVAIKFNDGDGAPLFSSNTAKALSLLDEDCELPTVDTVVSGFAEAEIPVTALFKITAHNYSEEAFDAVLAYEAALIRELYSGGVTEVILFYEEQEDFDYLAVTKAFANILRSDSFSKKLGVIIPYKALTAEDANSKIKELSACFDIIAADFTDVVAVEETDDAAPISAFDVTKERITNLNYLFTRYNLRVLVDVKSSFRDEIISAVGEMSPRGIINVELEYKFPQQVQE